MRLAYFTALLILLGSAAPARSNLIVEVGSGSVSQGGVGSIDVTIRSDDATSGDPLSLFGYEFLITPSSANRLEFLDPQENTAIIDSNYVFFLNSTDASLNQQQGVVSSSGGGLNNRLVGGDSTLDFSDITITTTPLLLARLDLRATTALSGQSFTISLEPTGNTFFLDSEFLPVAFQSTSGTVTIAPAAAVPEPSSLILASIAIPLTILRRSRAFLNSSRRP